MLSPVTARACQKAVISEARYDCDEVLPPPPGRPPPPPPASEPSVGGGVVVLIEVAGLEPDTLSGIK